MPDEPKKAYPNIYVATTDANLPLGFTNDFRKYSGFQPMAGGGNGVLFACHDNNLGRKVCIKKISPNAANGKRETRRLLREARVTAQMSHPICPGRSVQTANRPSM